MFRSLYANVSDLTQFLASELGKDYSSGGVDQSQMLAFVTKTRPYKSIALAPSEARPAGN